MKYPKAKTKRGQEFIIRTQISARLRPTIVGKSARRALRRQLGVIRGLKDPINSLNELGPQSEIISKTTQLSVREEKSIPGLYTIPTKYDELCGLISSLLGVYFVVHKTTDDSGGVIRNYRIFGPRNRVIVARKLTLITIYNLKALAEQLWGQRRESGKNWENPTLWGYWVLNCGKVSQVEDYILARIREEFILIFKSIAKIPFDKSLGVFEYIHETQQINPGNRKNKKPKPSNFFGNKNNQIIKPWHTYRNL